MNYSEQEIRSLIGEILSSTADDERAAILAEDQELRAEVIRRLDLCGLELIESERPRAVFFSDKSDLSELSQAALAICAVGLSPQPGQRRRPRLEVEEITARLRGNYQPSFVRRAVLGPLEARGLIKVIKPEQRAQGAYVVAGPALAAIDSQAILRRLEASRAA